MLDSWTFSMGFLRNWFDQLSCHQNQGCCRMYFTLSAMVFLAIFGHCVLPGLGGTTVVASSDTSGYKWTNNHKAVSEVDWRQTKSPRHLRRRHLKSRIARRKVENHRNAELEIQYLALHDKRLGSHDTGNGSDVINGYSFNKIPAIWESLRVKNKEQGETPRWQRLPTSEEISRFKNLVQKTMACRKLPALTLALVKDGQVVLRASLGHSDPEKQVPVSRNTRFAIGSLTKAFTSTLVSELLMRRNLSLDTAINQLIPENFTLMDEVRTRTVTVRDLLGHRTGVPGYFHALLMGFPAHVTRPKLVSRLRYIPAVVPLRYQFLYNNYLYTLAAHVVEKLTSRRWEALLRDVILRPLGMRSTGFVDEVEDFRHFALPCALVNGTFKNLMPQLLLSVSPCGPAGSLYSTAHDMARWLQMLLSNGRTPDGTQVLKAEALRETTRAVMPPPGIGTDLTKPDFPIADVEQSYGLGWVTSNYRGYEKVWHSGGIVTYSSRLWLLPGVKAGLFVATNGPQTRDKGHALTAITNMAADLLLGENPWLNESTICTFPAPWKPSETPPEEASSPATTTTTPRGVNDAPSVVGRPHQRGSISVFSKREDSVELDLNQLIGVYTHKAFGEIVIQRGEGGDVKEYDVREPGSRADVSAAETGNGSDWLMLKYGRFGQLRLKKARGGWDGGWEGWFVGPLWYMTASDEHRSPVRVHFLRDGSGHVDRIRYPIDGHYDDIEFRKRDHDVISSDLHSASCGSASIRSVAGGKVVLCVFAFLWLSRVGV